MARIDRKLRHFLEGAVLAGASLLVATGACPWPESGGVVRHDTERRHSTRHEPTRRELLREASPPEEPPAPEEVPLTGATPEAPPLAPRAEPAALPPKKLPEPAMCKSGLRLTGSIVVAGQPQHSLAALSQGGGTSLLHIGQSYGGLQLAGLLPRRAYMRDGSGAYCTLHLLPSAEPAKAPRATGKRRATSRTKAAPPFTKEELSAAIRPVGGDRYVVSRSFASQALGKLAGARGLGRFSPDLRDGRHLGLRVHGVKHNSPLGRLGIRNGDVLRALNGISLTGLDGFLAAAPLLQTERTLSLAVLRKGQPRTLEYTLE